MPISRTFLTIALVILFGCGAARATPVRSGEYVAIVADGQWWWLAPERAGNGTLLELRNSGPAVSPAFNMTQGVPVSNNTTFFITKVDGSLGEIHSGDYVRIRGINSDYFGNDPYLMVEGSDTNRVRVATPRGPRFVDGDPTIFFIDGLGQNVIQYGAPFIIRGTARGTTWFKTRPANEDEHIFFTPDPSQAARFSFQRPSAIARQDNASLRPPDEGGCGPYASRTSFGFCLPNCSGDICRAIGRILGESKAQALGNHLAVWIQASRNSAIGSAQPIPADIRQRLTGRVPANILDRARFKVDDNGFFNLGGLTVRYGDSVAGLDPQAVTLDDLIVFAPGANRADISLWAHELYHVGQYAEWGVRNFAIRYARDPDAVEKPAYEEQARY